MDGLKVLQGGWLSFKNFRGKNFRVDGKAPGLSLQLSLKKNVLKYPIRHIMGGVSAEA